ncbi:MAG TPA: hypothetical protein ENN13_05100, partial [Candidatus Altiarchaeales archaeon]|nr:hypothetical protein [Candidatus Altiarchaeales archaeon]
VLPIMLYYIIIVMGSNRRDGRRDGGANILLLIIGAQIASFMGRLLVMWLSRQREYYADAFSAYATSNPKNLMSGLAKISYGMPLRRTDVNPALSAFYISDPSPSEKQAMVEIVNAISSGDENHLRDAIKKEKMHGKLELFMTHPLTAKRLDSLNRIRKEMGG